MLYTCLGEPFFSQSAKSISSCVKEDGSVIEVRAVIFANALFVMTFVLSGICNVLIAVAENTPRPMARRVASFPLANSAVASAKQFSKA